MIMDQASVQKVKRSTNRNTLASSSNHFRGGSPSKFGSNINITDGSKGRKGSHLFDKQAPYIRQADIRVINEDGIDVTPMPLISLPRNATKCGATNAHHVNLEIGWNASKMSTSMISPVDFFTSVENQTISQMGSSAFGKSFTSIASIQASESSIEKSQEDVSMSSTGSVGEGEELTTKAKQEFVSHHMTPRELTEVELSRNVNIMLSETETVWLLQLPGVYVASDSPEAPAVTEANARYQALLASKATNNNFIDRGTQTFNNSEKNKEVQATLAKHSDADCNVNEWSIYDAYATVETTATATNGDFELGAPTQAVSVEAIPGLTVLKSVNSGIASSLESLSLVSPSLLSSNAMLHEIRSTMNDDNISELSFGTVDNEKHDASASDLITEINSESLRDSLSIMESAVLENTYMKRLLAYRDIPEVARPPSRSRPESHTVDVFESNIASLQFLWSYRCEITRDRHVTYMAWNKQNKDILAVSYSEQKTNPTASQGLICCWSLKNPEYPQRIYRSQTSTVTAIDFSSANPNLLAAGFSDGLIAIYDVRSQDETPALDSGTLSGKHRDPVWELKWVEREQTIGDEQNNGENLVSISTDGRVCRWQIRKGFEVTDLMALKSIVKRAEGTKIDSGATDGSKPSSFITRTTGGLCFDFSHQESSIYLVGTEDGTIHRCSCSYNEQYLSNYFGHIGPVYRVKWSPFLGSVFLSCSSDWTVRMWNAEAEDAVLMFQSGKDSIMDIAWSPNCATVFGSVSSDGRIEIWDLKNSILDPAIVHTVLDQKLTAITFSENSPVVLTGDDTGCVNVYKLRKLNMMTDKTREEQGKVLLGIANARVQEQEVGDVEENGSRIKEGSGKGEKRRRVI